MKKELILRRSIEQLASSMRERLDRTKSNATGNTRKNTKAIFGESNGELRARIQVPESAKFTDLGRRSGKRPPVSAIRRWVIAKGIAPRDSAWSVAFAISNKIAQKGTSKPPSLFITKPLDEFLSNGLPEVNKQIAESFKRETIKAIKENFK